MYIMSLVHISFISLCLLTTPSNYPFPQPWLWQPLNLISFSVSLVCFCFRFHKQVRSYRICLSLSNFTKVPLESIHTISRLVKDSACNVRSGFDPWVGKIPWRRERFPTPVFWPGEFHGLYSPQGRKESDMTEWLSVSQAANFHLFMSE